MVLCLGCDKRVNGQDGVLKDRRVLGGNWGMGEGKADAD